MDNKELRKLRLTMDITQAEMAKKLGVSLPMYSLYEREPGRLEKAVTVGLLAETLLNNIRNL